MEYFMDKPLVVLYKINSETAKFVNKVWFCLQEIIFNITFKYYFVIQQI